MNNRIPIILDADPGHDDAIAWVVANASDKLEILACTAVNGNCNISIIYLLIICPIIR